MLNLFIKGQALDLFQDETISFVLSIKNAKDISKVYSDFSRSFSVPWTDRNRMALGFYDDENVNVNISGVEGRSMLFEAYIEIDNLPFKKGLVEIESIKYSMQVPQSAQLRFYTVLKTLSNVLKDDKLGVFHLWNDLECNSAAIVSGGRQNGVINTESNFVSLLNSQFDISGFLPTLTCYKNVTYGDLQSTDIGVSGHFAHTDFAWALQCRRIFAGIINKYGIKIRSVFLNSEQFRDLFIVWHNQYSQQNQNTLSQPIEMKLKTTVGETYVQDSYLSTWTRLSIFRTTNADRIVAGVPCYTYARCLGWYAYFYSGYFRITLTPSVSFPVNSVFEINCYYRGIETTHWNSFSWREWNTITYNGNTATTIQIQPPNPFEIAGFAKYEYSVSFQEEVEIEFVFLISSNYNGNVNTKLQMYRYKGDDLTSTDTITQAIPVKIYDFSKNAPDIKIIDFVKGIVNMYNLIIYYDVANNQYVIEPYNYYQNIGKEIDLTRYIDASEYNKETLSYFNDITFQHKETEQVNAYGYKELGGEQFGTEKYQNNLSGDSIKIDTPFSLPMQSKFGTYLLVTQSIDKDLNPIFSPFVFYRNPQSSDDAIYIGTTLVNEVVNIFSFFGHKYNNTVINDLSCLSFSNEQSLYEWPAGYIFDATGLYIDFWSVYFESIFSNMSRKYKISAYLPPNICNILALNDKIKIDDKLMSIDSISLNINTGKADMDLIYPHIKGGLEIKTLNYLTYGANAGEIYPYNTTIYLDYLGDSLYISIPKATSFFGVTDYHMYFCEFLQYDNPLTYNMPLEYSIIEFNKDNIDGYRELPLTSFSYPNSDISDSEYYRNFFSRKKDEALHFKITVPPLQNKLSELGLTLQSGVKREATLRIVWGSSEYTAPQSGYIFDPETFQLFSVQCIRLVQRYV